MLLVDTDIVIRAFNHSGFLNFLAPYKPTVGTVVNIESIQGSKSKAEIKDLEAFIEDKFKRLVNTGRDFKTALALVRRHSSSLGILLGDALMGARR